MRGRAVTGHGHAILRLLRDALRRGGLRDDAGAALPAVLLLVVVLSALAASVALVHLARSKRGALDLHEARSLYAAEGGVARALARLVDEPGWRPEGAEVLVGPAEGAHTGGTATGAGRAEGAGPDERTARVWVRALGGHLQVAAEARRGRAEGRALALVAQAPPGALRAAVVFGDTLSPLTLAGSATVTGDVVLGPRGLTTGALTRRPYRGSHDGDVVVVRGDPLPALDDAPFRETLDRLDRYLDALPDEVPVGLARAVLPAVQREEGPFTPSGSADSVRVYTASPGAVVSAADARALGGPNGGPALVLGGGDLRLEGPLRLPPGAQVVARGRLEVVGAVGGEGLVLVGDRVLVDGPALLQGQALGRRALSVDGGAAFSYPSALYVRGPTTAGAPPADDDRLEVGRAAVEGAVLYPSGYPAGDGPPVGSSGEPARLVVGPGALVRGAVYAGRRAEVAGRVEGTLLVRGLHFYESPASYVNWLADAAVDRPARPDPFAVPVGVGARPAFVVVALQASARRPSDRR